ncbi:hypothetical protein DFH08DRAFT_829518 [Mycena albidolilacea]|uniref:C2H2-type domain-containing protein n=1 Tax=Mycena albidolilacea TaxID=1033008 RepID=A0AAD7ATV6_9AGAR|nr:hypothetical protein DFH08DRAFT_829518 [Mycena albidolilacea]
MSSWNSSYPPPPRRSRSRSPARGSYPPRDAPYPPDQYRDWETYDRDRAWASYDRERPPYDYRRGRSRSPPPELNRKRQRSGSPYDRERYDPRPRYEDYDGHRPYGYSSPPRRGQYPPARRPPPDPHTFDYPASLKQYAEWFRYFYSQQAIEEDNADKAAEQEAGDGSKPRNGIKSKWEKYKKDFAAGQLQTMFDHHRKSPWFSEKYDPAPEFENLRKRVRKEGWKDRLNTFLLDLESGKFDPDLTPEAETTDIPSSPVKENGPSAANGEPASDSVAANPNGAAAPISEEPKASGDDDEMQFNMNINVDEDLPADADTNRPDANGKGAANSGNNNGNRRASDRGDEVSVMPEGNQVMIRTIPPDIGRVKLEDACSKVPGYMYIALGDPLQKRNYYRAGWLRFRDDADMGAVVAELSETKIEGFKLHVTHNVKPFVNRMRYAPEVSSRPDRMEKDLANAKALVTKLEAEAAELRKLKVARGKLVPSEGAAGANGEDVPMEGAAEEDAEEEEPEPRERGCDAVERRVEKIMADLRAQELVDVNDDKAYEMKKTMVSLDLYLAYLRAAFHTCYYCAIVTDHLEELQRKCLKHERKPLSKMLLEELKAAEAAEKAASEKEKKLKEEDGGEEAPTEEKEKEKETNKGPGRDRGDKDWRRTDERWVEWLDSKIALLINREGVEPRDYGGKNYDDELTKAVEPYLKQEDEGKFRCKTCQKLFKATSFVEKHIANKHPELVKSLDEIPYFNNFALDPHRIQPFAHPPTATGNGQLPPPQAYGMQAPPQHGGDNYGRGQYGGGGGGGGYGQGYPPPGYGGSQWDHHGRDGYPPGYGGGHQGRRDDGGANGRRLSERLGGFAEGAGLPPKPTAATMDGALVSGSGGGNQRGGRNGGRGGGGGPLPPPPPDAKEDPRAAAGKRVSYHDMDLVAEGDVELFY